MIDHINIEKVFGNNFQYDNNGFIFGVANDGNQVAIEIRGWIRIEKILGSNNAIKFQDEFGQWVADAMNEKLQRQTT